MADKRWPAPIGFELDITNLCQLRCPHCTNLEYRIQNTMQLEPRVVEDVLEDMASLGAKAVCFTGGGEPLMHPYFPELFERAYSLMDASLITNGVLLGDPYDSDAELEAIMGAVWVRVSLDAADASEYRERHGIDAIDLALDSIRALVQKRGGWNAPTIGVGYLTDTGTTTEKALRVARLCKMLGADYLQFRPIHYAPWDDRFEGFSWGRPPMDFDRVARESTSAYKVIGSAPKYAVADDPFKRDYDWCAGLMVNAVVGATGDVWPCCHLRGLDRFSLGNVNERRLKDIWDDHENRLRVYGQIDFETDCMPLCRFHHMNTLLKDLWGNPDEAKRLQELVAGTEPVHVNFL